VFPSLTDLPVRIPVAMGLGWGCWRDQRQHHRGHRYPFIATLGMMVSARGLARYYTEGQPVSMLSDSYTAIGHGAMPVIIFLVVAVIFHIALRYTKYGKYTYAIGGNMQAARLGDQRQASLDHRLQHRRLAGRPGRRGRLGTRGHRSGGHGHVL
jgi:inositol transport system permease protein